MGEASRQNKQLRSPPLIHTAYRTPSGNYIKQGTRLPQPWITERFRLDVHNQSTADFAISRKIGGAFLAPERLPRCRSPPASEIRTQQISETEGNISVKR